MEDIIQLFVGSSRILAIENERNKMRNEGSQTCSTVDREGKNQWAKVISQWTATVRPAGTQRQGHILTTLDSMGHSTNLIKLILVDINVILNDR